MTRLLFFCSAFCLTLIFSTSAVTQDKKPASTSESDSPLSVLYDCAAIVDTTKRLSCYDQAAAGLRTAEQNKELVAIDAQSAKKIKREAFGFNLPSLPKLGLPKIGNDKNIDALVMDVKSVRKRNHKYVIVLKNGQVWQQTGGRLTYVPKGDLVATIKPKSVGSYGISLSNGKSTVRGLRVRRLE